MTTIDFPLSPVAGQEFEAAGTTYVFNGTGWVIQPVDPSGTFYTKTESDVRYVNVSGDVMTGLLSMPYMPTVPEHVVNKAYADSLGGLTQATADVRYVNITGDDMTGPLLTLAPTAGGHATNKTYVDAADALKADKTYVDAGDAAANANANNRVIRTGDAMTGQLRMNLDGDAFAVRGSVYGMIMHHNSSDFYLMLTAANDPQGGWNTLRPFIINYASGNVTMSHTVSVGGNCTVSGELRTNSYAKAPTYYFGDTGYYWTWDGSNVACNGNIYGHASMVINGNISAQTNFWCNGGTVYFRSNGGIYLTHDGSNFSFAGAGAVYGPHFQGSYLTATASDGIRVIAAGGYARVMYSCNARQYSVGASPTDGWFIFADDSMGYVPGGVIPGGEFRWHTHLSLDGGNGWKPGGGSWADSSDIRIKNILGEYDHGLKEVLALRPVIYTFKGNDSSEEPTCVDQYPDEHGNPRARDSVPLTVPYRNSLHGEAAREKKRFIGLIAQDVEPIFPEMIFDRKGYIDNKPVDDIKAMDTSPLIYALVNAIKELTARIEVLEGK
jgi:Long-tail fiber proximal subunit, C-terminal, trimerization domain